MGWPKTILVRGLEVPVDSWEEFDELLQRYGGEVLVVTASSESGTEPKRPKPSGGGALDPGGRALLQHFVAGNAKGVPTKVIGHAIGAKGKGIRPALEKWSREIGLVTSHTGSAFEPVRRFDGRAYKLTEVHLMGARAMLGM